MEWLISYPKSKSVIIPKLCYLEPAIHPHIHPHSHSHIRYHHVFSSFLLACNDYGYQCATCDTNGCLTCPSNHWVLPWAYCGGRYWWFASGWVVVVIIGGLLPGGLWWLLLVVCFQVGCIGVCRSILYVFI